MDAISSISDGPLGIKDCHGLGSLQVKSICSDDKAFFLNDSFFFQNFIYTENYELKSDVMCLGTETFNGTDVKPFFSLCQDLDDQRWKFLSGDEDQGLGQFINGESGKCLSFHPEKSTQDFSTQMPARFEMLNFLTNVVIKDLAKVANLPVVEECDINGDNFKNQLWQLNPNQWTYTITKCEIHVKVANLRLHKFFPPKGNV